MYVKECDKALSQIDYNLLLDAIINDYGYDDFIRSKNDRANLLMVPKYKDMDDKGKFKNKSHPFESRVT